ncbi:unnamed protein product [Rotaria sp. Silwood2]|nr:unnamed protein product [Rotaria sp. Silwood2]CAF2939173.1 unnamed protein product [Rotaria sp. Silwood2]CAF3305019.1 unnamed protein product [Rotaria sp. Silwood2]CAF3389367.1 unnamed protein product [Rotaria sp. Silwood2]CAF3913571.1 unnamed protein product [Rotaria sp. Silwood2]
MWRCYKNNCAGRVCFDGTQYVKVTDHIHAPTPEEIISIQFKSKIADIAVTSHYPPRRVINEALLTISKDDGAAVPNYTSSQRTIERKRKKKDIPLPRPKSFNEIRISDELKATNGGSRFLLYDNEDSVHRIIILSSDDDLDRLSNSEHWHSDGTFKIAPQLFEQLYVIHGFICGRALPLVYCMLSGKSEALYDEIFNVILQHVSGRPKSITIDFEKAVENVIKNKLPMTSISGCFFHFKQCLWRKIQNLGLQELFVDNSEARRYLKTFGCLSLIPEASVILEFERIQISAPDSIANFVDYFEDTFIGRLIRNNRRRAARFSINMWNCFSRLAEDLPRTNNSSEGWNRAIKNSARENPSIYESIIDLKMEQHANLITAEQLQAGRVKIRKRVKYEYLDEQLQQLASTFHLITRDLYFKRARALFNF